MTQRTSFPASPDGSLKDVGDLLVGSLSVEDSPLADHLAGGDISPLSTIVTETGR
jgi:hypothetical protein